MTDFLSHILTWRLPVALLILGLAVLPVRKAYRMLRNGDIWQKGAVEELFLSSLLVALSAAFYPITILGILGIWWAFATRHLLNMKGFLASLTAVALVALYYALAVFAGWISIDNFFP